MNTFRNTDGDRDGEAERLLESVFGPAPNTGPACGPGPLLPAQGPVPVEEEHWEETLQRILCPYCGGNNTHRLGITSVSGHDDYRAWNGRGDALAIGFEGECGHEWTLGLGFHKGETFMFVSRPLPKIEPLEP